MILLLLSLAYAQEPEAPVEPAPVVSEPTVAVEASEAAPDALHGIIDVLWPLLASGVGGGAAVGGGAWWLVGRRPKEEGSTDAADDLRTALFMEDPEDGKPVAILRVMLSEQRARAKAADEHQERVVKALEALAAKD